MTYQRANLSDLHERECAGHVSERKISTTSTKPENTRQMQRLNDELTFDENRKCHLAVAANDQILSSLRDDVTQTTDFAAYVDLLKYVKSDLNTFDTHKDSQIAEFYAGRSVFITGASGFVGKCLLEKVLRSCPKIKEVFILMRPKRGRDVSERMDTLINSELFDRLRLSPYGQEQFNKIIPIKGDITEPCFGLAKQDIELLATKVSVLFHSAATVKFVEPLRVAVENNVVSVNNLLNLAAQFKSLEVLVHVSTAYSNCDRQQVDEVLYETPMDAKKLMEMAKWMDPETFDNIAPILIGKRPNTYTYTKAVAESLLIDGSKKLLPNVPIAMVRPSIVGGIWRQPISGWVDNFNGPTGVMLSMMTGAIQAMLACPNYCADIVPVDIVANLLICTAWQVHTEHRKNQADTQYNLNEDSKANSMSNSNEPNIRIFNCVSGSLNPVVWGDFTKYVQQIGLVFPCNGVLRVPGRLLVSNEYLFNLFNFMNHTVVAYGGDFVLKLMGKKPTFVIVYNRLMKMIETLKPFTTNQWLFKCKNVTYLYETLSPVDKEIFNFDIRQVRWDEYLRRYYVGSKIFALKDDPSSVVRARKKLRMIKMRGSLLQLLVMVMAYYFLLNGTATEQYLLESMRRVFSHVINNLDYGIDASKISANNEQVATY